MIKITEENLKWAYKKLKYYIYYYKSLNYLKDKIYDFEKKYDGNMQGFSDFFKQTSAEFNALNPEDNLCKYALHYRVYPKKDSIKVDRLNKYSVSEVNFFIDMDLKLYLVDVLFALSIFEENIDNVDVVHTFGNVFSKNLVKNNCIENSFLFENHKIQYKNWKNNIFKDLDFIDDKYAIVVKLDMERCFYNFEFDFKNFTENKIKSLDKQILIIERYIYNMYTKQLYADFPQDKGTSMPKNKNKNVCILPIGLLSTYAIMNYYFHELDKLIISNDLIINYGRYVDDMLFLVKYDENYVGQKGKDLVKTVLQNVLISDSDKIYFDCQKMGLQKSIPLKDSKIKVKMVKIENLKNRKENLSDMYAASLENDDRESCVQMENDDIASMRGYFFNSEISDNKKIEKISNMEDVELLNAYPIWKYMFSVMSIDMTNLNELKAKINNAINNVIFGKETKITKWIISTLNKELNTAYSLVNDEKYKEYFIDEIDQLNYFSFINSYEEQTEMYNNVYKYTFPLIVSREMLMLYFAETIETDEHFVNRIATEYKNINNIDMPPLNFEIYERENILNVCDNKIEKIIEKKYKTSEGNIDKKVKIAVVNMNIPEDKVEEFDLQEIYPLSFSYSTIRKIIISASKHGANYIIFPEFSIPYHNAFKVINLAKENHVSIISGLTHKLYVEENGKMRVIRYRDKDDYDKVYAKNLTLIYDDYLKIVNFYVKKNFAPKEIELLLKNKIYGITGDQASKVYHSIINYGILTCFDATDINLRGKYKNYVDTLFLPVMNRDTEYFSAIIKSLSRDLSAYVIQSNITKYGDSRITGPFEAYKADIIKSKGGINCYYVLGIVDYCPLYNRLLKDKESSDYLESIKREFSTDEHYKQYKEINEITEKDKFSKHTPANVDFEKSITNQKDNGLYKMSLLEINEDDLPF